MKNIGVYKLIKNILDRRKLVTQGNMYKAILLLAVPVALNNFIHASYELIDTLFVSSIGSVELAAITFVGPINNMVRAISDGLAIGGTSLIGREVGRENYSKAKSISNQLLILAIIIGMFVSTIGFLFSNQLLLSASATENLLGVANIYFKLTVLSAPFIFINSSYIAIKRASGDTLKPMHINFIAMFIKVITTYIMIFRLNMGVNSLAISTIIGSVFVSVVAFYDLFVKKALMKLKFFPIKIDCKVIMTILIIGIPIIIEKSSASYSFIMVNKYILAFGEDVLSGYGITNKINSLSFSTVTGIGTGLAVIVSQNLGAKQVQRAREGVKKSFIVAIGIAVFIIAMIFLAQYPIASLFAQGNQVILYHTINAMNVYSISVIPWAIFQVVIGVFQGTGHTRMNLYISLARIYIFRLPLVILLTKISTLQEYSIWYAMLFSNILTAVFALILYWKNHNNLKLMGETKESNVDLIEEEVI
jgi:putative MATE family efflux protein